MKGSRRLKDGIAALTLAALVVALAPGLWRALGLLFESGAASVGVAGLLTVAALVVASAVAAFGVVFSRSWGRWSGRGVGLYWIFVSSGLLAARSSVRLGAVALLAAGGFLIIALSPAAEDLSASPTTGERLRNLIKGWAIAFDVAAIPAILTTLTSAAAQELGRSLLLHGAGVTLAVLVVTAGALLIPRTRLVGAALGFVGAALALGLLVPLVDAATHRELLLLYPATATSLVALLLAIFGGSRRSAA
jgi:hypothetical protein